MSTSSPKNTRLRAVGSLYSVHHHRGAAALAAGAAYAAAVAMTGAPVALLAGLFVPLSLGAESAFRAARPGPLDHRAEALATGLGVLAGAAATVTLVFGAGALGL